MSKGILKIFENSADLSLFKQTTGLSGRLMLRAHMENHNADFFQDVTVADFCTSTMDSHFTTIWCEYVLRWWTLPTISFTPPKTIPWNLKYGGTGRLSRFLVKDGRFQGVFAVSFRECILFVGRCHFHANMYTLAFTGPKAPSPLVSFVF